MQIKESPATKHLARPFELKALSEDGVFSGYGAVFGNIDLGLDIVQKGAFKRSLAEHKAAKTMPKLLWQHDTWQPIGIYTDMYEDEKGLYVEGKLALKTIKGAEAYELLLMGAISGLSIGYNASKYEYDTETYVRKLIDVDLWECSLVTFAMNPEATVSGVKGAELTEREFEQLLTRDAGFSRSQAIVIINDGFKSLKTTRDAGLSLHDLLGDMKAANQQLANLNKE
jgi:HK97 family phage prohead protease